MKQVHRRRKQKLSSKLCARRQWNECCKCFNCCMYIWHGDMCEYIWEERLQKNTSGKLGLGEWRWNKVRRERSKETRDEWVSAWQVSGGHLVSETMALFLGTESKVTLNEKIHHERRKECVYSFSIACGLSGREWEWMCCFHLIIVRQWVVSINTF